MQRPGAETLLARGATPGPPRQPPTLSDLRASGTTMRAAALRASGTTSREGGKGNG